MALSLSIMIALSLERYKEVDIMAENIVYKKVTDLTEKTEALDNDLLMVGHDGTAEFRKFKWSNFMNNIKAK